MRKIERKGNELLITVPLSDAARDAAELPKSGKTRLLATTGGFVAVDGTDVKVSLNVIIPK